MRRFLLLLISAMCVSSILSQRQEIRINGGWRFSLGHASDAQKDFTHGCEYFTYLAKARSHNQNKGPAAPSFVDSTWQKVTLPHDWVVDLPYAREASHSHGYKMVGWKYPENSVGWYRRHLDVSADWKGKQVYIIFDGIFRDAQVFCNGFYLGTEPSGYVSQVYDITEYLDYGKENVLTVRADASLEEGWYYEGGGIYRNVHIVVVPKLHVAEWGVSTECILNDNASADIKINTEIRNNSHKTGNYRIINRLLDAEGSEVARSETQVGKIGVRGSENVYSNIHIGNPKLWDCDTPCLYKLRTELTSANGEKDIVDTPIGIRSIAFDEENGFLLNGKPVKLKGVNLHLDHAGVGTGIPDELWKYRISKLKEIGVNAIRSSHNPASPSMLDICDREGILVIDENRLMGVNKGEVGQLRHMINRDRNHPCVILWSIGNEEWAIENNEIGLEIACTLTDYVHALDPSRPSTAGIAGGTVLLKGLDVKGYNYIHQNRVDSHKKADPSWKAVGTEETSGCGTRGVYFTNPDEGWMAPINRTGTKYGARNVIEEGWKFYDERDWLGGLFYWTGLDYRGEPNPMSYPATGSQFGILDYCGFPKDEAFYLQSWWTEKPTLHIFPHWNLSGHENEKIEVWAYSNCDKVRLSVNNKDLGTKDVPQNGHLSWTATYRPGKVEATGYKNGKKIMKEIIETTGIASVIDVTPHKDKLLADGEDIIVVDMTLLDKKGRFVPDACVNILAEVDGPAEILGFGNGNPGFKQTERPIYDKNRFEITSFNGHAQLILRSIKGVDGDVRLRLALPGGERFLSLKAVK